MAGENTRRKTKFNQGQKNNLLPLTLVALAIAIVVHAVVYAVFRCLPPINFTNTSDVPQENVEEVLRPIVMPSQETKEDKLAPDMTPDPPAIEDDKPLELDPVDLPLPDPTEVVIKPGETDLGTSVIDQAETTELPSPSIDDLAQSTDTVADILMPHTGNPDVLIPATETLGDDDNGLGDLGSNADPEAHSFKDLLAQAPGTLGQKSGHGVIGADLLFEYNQAILKQSALQGLLQLASLIDKHSTTQFIIEGHTDSFGGKEYNQLLSLMRANAVREWLKTNGIDVSRVYILACGDDRPVVKTGDKDKQAPNRRVEIHMRAQGEALPSGALPHTYKVDMVTPIATQLARRNGANVPTVQAQPAASSKKAQLPVKQATQHKATSTLSTPSVIPMAEPVEDQVSDIPYAEALPDEY